MKIFEVIENKRTVISESGSLPDVGAIHIDEIKPTLVKLEKDLGLNLQDFALGSVGKREYSGDIDIAINLKPEQIPEFIEKLEASPHFDHVTKTSVIMTRVKIENFDKSKDGRQPRTGFVQVDFMPGDPGWMKTYYHAPHETESKYKGVMRNLILATVAAIYNRNDSSEKVEDGRPLESERYLFSPRDGLVRVIRRPVPKKNGQGYTKKHTDEIIEGPWRTAEEIADILNLGSVQALNSFESMLDAIKKNHTPEVYNEVVKGLRDNRQVQDIGIPDEIK